MKPEEREELHCMHQLITEVGTSPFDSKFLERYVELFAKSLEGKGNYEHADQKDFSIAGS